jgi:phosphopantetheinyl transferase (holo-ACP synthase)
VRALVRYRRIDNQRVEADIDALDEDGSVFMRVEGWQTWRMPWPPSLQKFIFKPVDNVIGSRRPSSDPDMILVRVAREEHLGGMALDWIARHYLTMAEWGEYKRGRPDHLLGRIAAKDAARLWLREQKGLQVHPLEIEITNLESGAPVLRAPGGLMLAVSIAHLENVAIAAVAGDQSSLGVDLVEPAERGRAFDALAFDDDELTVIRNAGRNEREWLHRAWSAKEAAAKAIGKGLESIPRLRVQSVMEERIAVFSTDLGRSIQVETRIDNGHAEAIASIRRQTEVRS